MGFGCDLPSEATVLDLVKTAVIELVENAFEHGGQPATVRVVVDQLPDGQVAISIADEGPGLPEMEQKVLDGEIEDPLNHSQGFGLWMAYWLIQLAGGSITYEENDPTGARICVRVPLTAAKD